VIGIPVRQQDRVQAPDAVRPQRRREHAAAVTELEMWRERRPKRDAAETELEAAGRAAAVAGLLAPLPALREAGARLRLTAERL